MPPEAGAFGCLGCPFISRCFRSRGSHIFLFSADLILVLLLPSFPLGLLELRPGKAHFLAVPDTQIFLFCFVLPLFVFSQWPHRHHNVGMGVMSVRIVDAHIGAHPVCNEIILDKFRQQAFSFVFLCLLLVDSFLSVWGLKVVHPVGQFSVCTCT